jgi:23S rRNA pseudouridine955/2504/2580 synthase
VRKRRDLTEDEMEFALSMVIHKDDAALVINKPAGLATQGGTKTENHVDGLLDALGFELDSRPKLVHRLDKDTSGALLLARTSRSAGHFAKAFSSRTARKVYWALVVGVPDIADGFIDLPIGKQPGSGGEKMHVDEKDGQSARTRYRIVERAGNATAWVELQPYTGRTHQLRVHMAAIGHPIVGDGKYGGKDAFLTGTISRKMHLHARRIRIDHPAGHQIDVRADLPPHMKASFDDLGFDMELGDALVLDAPKFSETAEGKKRVAANIAKSARKERKGERRSRGSVADKPKDKKRSQMAAGKKIAAKKPVIKKAVTGKAPAKRAPAKKPAGPVAGSGPPGHAKSRHQPRTGGGGSGGGGGVSRPRQGCHHRHPRNHGAAAGQPGVALPVDGEPSEQRHPAHPRGIDGTGTGASGRIRGQADGVDRGARRGARGAA